MHAFMFQPHNSPVHQLSSVSKIISLACLFILAVISSNFFFLLALTLFMLVTVLISKSLVPLLRIRAAMLLLFSFPTILWSFYYEGQTLLFSIGPFHPTKEGLIYGLSMGLRLISMLIAGLILLSATRIEEFTDGLHYLGAPYRMCFSLSLAFRLVPIFFHTFDIISQAQRSRGLNIQKGNLIVRIKSAIPLLIPVFMTALRQTDHLSIALESRGFGYSHRRTRATPMILSKADKIVIALSILSVASIASLRILNLIS